MNINLFLEIFKNKLLFNYIFNNVKQIQENGENNEIYKWNDLLKQPHLLGYYNYIDQFKQIDFNEIIKRGRFDRVVVYSIMGGNLDILRYLIQLYPNILNKEITHPNSSLICRRGDLLFYAAMYGKLDIIKYLESLNSNNSNIKEWNYQHATAVAPTAKDINLFKYFFNKIDIVKLFNVKNDLLLLLRTMIESGDVVMFDWFLNQIQDIQEIVYISSSGYLIDNVLKNNDFEMLKYMHQKNIGTASSDALDIPILNKNYEMAMWLQDNRPHQQKCTMKSFLHAAYYGDLYLVQWLHHNFSKDGINCHTSDEIYRASLGGQLKVVKWLHENCKGCLPKIALKGGPNISTPLANYSSPQFPIDFAAQCGHLEVIKWLHHNRSEVCTKYAMSSAAINGHLDVVKWLHNNRTEGCFEFTMSHVAIQGGLDVLKWFHANRPEGFTKEAMDCALKYSNLNVVEWLQKNHY